MPQKDLIREISQLFVILHFSSHIDELGVLPELKDGMIEGIPSSKLFRNIRVP